MTRTLYRLSTLKVARAKRPGMYADGGSLYLRVADGGSKQWVFRYSANGRLRDMPDRPRSHADARRGPRERATEARKLRLDGIDPLAHKHARMAALRAADAKAMTFRQCAEGFIKDNERGMDERNASASVAAKPAGLRLPDFGLAPGRRDRHAVSAQGDQAAVGADAGNGIAGARADRECPRLGHRPPLSLGE